MKILQSPVRFLAAASARAAKMRNCSNTGWSDAMPWSPRRDECETPNDTRNPAVSQRWLRKKCSWPACRKRRVGWQPRGLWYAAPAAERPEIPANGALFHRPPLEKIGAEHVSVSARLRIAADDLHLDRVLPRRNVVDAERKLLP